jgi:hypothetical protein
MFVDIVQECVVGNIFGTDKKVYKIGVDLRSSCVLGFLVGTSSVIQSWRF